MYEITDFRVDFYQIAHISSDFFSCLFNGFLIFLILTKTSKSFRSYAVLLFSIAISELIVGISCELSMTRIIPIKHSLTFEFRGLCRHFGSFACLTAHAISIHSTSFVYSVYPFLFWFRYQVLHHPPRNPFRIAVFCLLIYAPAFFTLLLFLSNPAPEIKVLEIWRQANFSMSTTDRSRIAIGGFETVFDYRVICLTLWTTCPVFPCYAMSIYFRRKFLIDIRRTAMCEKTRKAQAKIVRSLTIQSIFPIFPMTMAAAYNYKQFMLPYYEYVPYYDEWPMLSVTITSCLSPLLTMFYIQPYRRAILGWIIFWPRKNRIPKRRPTVYTLEHHPSKIPVIVIDKSELSIRYQ